MERLGLLALYVILLGQLVSVFINTELGILAASLVATAMFAVFLAPRGVAHILTAAFFRPLAGGCGIYLRSGRRSRHWTGGS